MRPFGIIACGVGGQGIVRMCNVIGEACATSGVAVRTGELHGLAQRSGSVVIHQRIGERSISPLIPYGEADVILALEPMEALRHVNFLKPGGTVITETTLQHPPGETADLATGVKERYVSYAEVIGALRSVAKVVELDALAMANEAGNAMTVNIVLVGALTALEGFPLGPGAVLDAVRSTVPASAVEVNERAFALGRQTMAADGGRGGRPSGSRPAGTAEQKR